MKLHRINQAADAPEALSVNSIGAALDLTRLIPAVVRAHLAGVAVGEELAEAFLIGRWPPLDGLRDQPHVAQFMGERALKNERRQAPQDGHPIDDPLNLCLGPVVGRR